MTTVQIRKSILAGLGLMALLASSGAMAGTIVLVNGVSISFSTTSSAVPLDRWTSVMIGTMLAIAAYFLLRRQGSRLSLWIALSVLAGTGAYGLKDSKWFSTAEAAPNSVNYSLTSSPAQINLWAIIPNSCYAIINAKNNTGQMLTINSINWHGSCSEVGPPLQTPQCTVGLQMAPNTSCYLFSDTAS